MAKSSKRNGRAAKRILIIAGPNGAGKTTFATEYLQREADCPEFINADLMARGLAPFDPDRAAYEAGKLMLARIGERTREGRSFAFETTLSGLVYARRIPQWRAVGYHVTLIFLELPSLELALFRIRTRVAQGGHDVPESTVRRRYSRGYANLEKVYKAIVDDWVVYDNSGSVPKWLAGGENS